MAILIIPLAQDTPSFAQRTMLDGAVFGLELRWNERESAWYYTLSDALGLPIRACKLVLGYPLLRNLIDTRRPKGELFLVDTAGTGQEAGLSDLGVRCQLRYIDAKTMAEFSLPTRAAPPVSPAKGDRYRVAAAPTGAFIGHGNQIAEWSGSAWVFTSAGA